MKKLRLEDLAVDSFHTSPAPPAKRGTVNARCVEPSGPIVDTYHIDRCGDTRYFDCTLGCSHITNCADCADHPSALCVPETADCPA